MRFCNKCKTEKNIEDFYNRRSYCKDCAKKEYKIYLNKNKDKINSKKREKYDDYQKQLGKEYRIKNKEHRKTINRAYKIKNKDLHNKLNRERLKNDPIFKLKRNLRHRLKMALKDNKIGSAIKDLGCDLPFLKYFFELQFYPNPDTGEMMTWENQGLHGWHIDHITPMSSAKTEEELIKLCHYTNLQPLWAKDNLKKGDKII